MFCSIRDFFFFFFEGKASEERSRERFSKAENHYCFSGAKRDRSSERHLSPNRSTIKSPRVVLINQRLPALILFRNHLLQGIKTTIKDDLSCLRPFALEITESLISVADISDRFFPFSGSSSVFTDFLQIP